MQSAFLSRGLWCMLGGFFCRCKLKPEQANNDNKEKDIFYYTRGVWCIRCVARTSLRGSHETDVSWTSFAAPGNDSGRTTIPLHTTPQPQPDPQRFVHSSYLLGR